MPYDTTAPCQLVFLDWLIRPAVTPDVPFRMTSAGPPPCHGKRTSWQHERRPSDQSHLSKSQLDTAAGSRGGRGHAGRGRPPPAAAVFARRCSLVGKNLVHRVFKISPGHSSLPLRLKGLVSEPWHRSSVSCSLPRPVLPQPTIAHTHSRETFLDDSKANSHVGRTL